MGQFSRRWIWGGGRVGKLARLPHPTSLPDSPKAHSPMERTYLKLVEQQLQDLGGGHGAVDADIGDRAISWCEN